MTLRRKVGMPGAHDLRMGHAVADSRHTHAIRTVHTRNEQQHNTSAEWMKVE